MKNVRIEKEKNYKNLKEKENKKGYNYRNSQQISPKI